MLSDAFYRLVISVFILELIFFEASVWSFLRLFHIANFQNLCNHATVILMGVSRVE